MAMQMFGLGIPPKMDDPKNRLYIVQKDGEVGVRQLQKTICSTLPMLAREPVGNLLENSYKPRVRAVLANPCTLSPLSKKKLANTEQRKVKEEEDKKLKTVLMQHAARRLDNRVARSLEVIDDLRQKELRKEEERRRERDEQASSKQMLLADAEVQRQQQRREAQELRERKLADFCESKSELKQLANVRAHQSRARRAEERNAVESISSTHRGDLNAQLVRRHQQREEEVLQRQHELKQKEDSKRRARRVERHAERVEASYVESFGRRADERQRQRHAEAVSIHEFQQEQIRQNNDKMRTLREEDLKCTLGNSLHPPPTAPPRQARPNPLFSTPSTYRDHKGRTLYMWGKTTGA